MQQGINTLLDCRTVHGKECCGCINGYKRDDGTWIFACNECEKALFTGTEMDEEQLKWFKGYAETLTPSGAPVLVHARKHKES